MTPHYVPYAHLKLSFAGPLDLSHIEEEEDEADAHFERVASYSDEQRLLDDINLEDEFEAVLAAASADEISQIDESFVSPDISIGPCSSCVCACPCTAINYPYSHSF